MGLRSLFFLSWLGVAMLAAPFFPLAGVMGYLGHYYVWPENQWWGEILQRYEIRVSLTLAMLTAAGIALNWPRIRAQTPGSLFHRQEGLLWLYVAVAGLSLLWGLPENPDYPPPGDPPFWKILKVAVFVFMLTHVASTQRDFHRLQWFILLVGGGYLGWEAYTAPPGTFTKGRLDRIGGPDFAESSFLGAHFAVMGVFAGMILLRCRGNFTRLMCLGCGALVANGLILTRTRAAFLAVVAGGVAAVVLADRKLRKWVMLLMVLGALGGLALADENFWQRVESINVEQEDLEASAASRLTFWRASFEMFLDHPLGVGAGNFFGEIGHYLPEHPGRDTHSTYFRCLAELGLPGIIALGALIVNAFVTLAWCRRTARDQLGADELATDAWGLQVMLVVMLTAGAFMSMTYTEELFLVLALPVCLQRVVQNRLAERQFLPEYGHA